MKKKKEAAEKVAKLLRLAKGTKNVHEAASARKQAEKIMNEHALTEEDLACGRMAIAFDELVDLMSDFVLHHPKVPEGLFDTTTIVADVLKRIKSIEETDKSIRLKQFVTLIRTTSFVAGDHPLISGLKHLVDITLKKHEILI